MTFIRFSNLRSILFHRIICKYSYIWRKYSLMNRLSIAQCVIKMNETQIITVCTYFIYMFYTPKYHLHL